MMVYSPGSEEGVICPPCSRTMSWDKLMPNPVCRLPALVVKKGLKILDMISGVIPTPLSRILIAAPSGVRRVSTLNSGSYPPPDMRARSAMAWQALVTRLVKRRARSSSTAWMSPRSGSMS